VLPVSALRLQASVFPSMCQDETKIISGTVRAGVALTSGALFGMAAQTALRYFGLDLASVHGELIVDGAARPALASWVWWFLAIAAFFAGPLSVVLTRRFLADRRLFRGPRLLAWVVLVLGLVTLAHLAPSTLGMTSAPHGFLVVVLSALLAAVGARLAHAAEADRSSEAQVGRDRAAAPFPIFRPGRGGSVNSGLPMRRPRRSLMPRARYAAGVALAAVTPIVVLGAVSTLSGAVVMRELLAPVAIREVPLRQAKVEAPAPRAEVLALAEPAGADPRAAVAAIRPEPVRAAPPPVRQPVVRVTAQANPRVPMSASELTFAKGYAKRRAALQAAKTAQAPPTPEIKPAAKSASRTAALAKRTGQSHRRGTYARHGGYQRYAAYDRYTGSKRYAGHSRDRARDRYGGYDRYAHYDWKW
jgi:hypothetical protein